jgi:hypothetical protein
MTASQPLFAASPRPDDTIRFFIAPMDKVVRRVDDTLLHRTVFFRPATGSVG